MRAVHKMMPLNGNENPEFAAFGVEKNSGIARVQKNVQFVKLS
jgi:hypothetical protein